jgi:hypothetical protein
MSIPSEIELQISDREDELTATMKTDNDYQIGCQHGFGNGYRIGATEWAGKAQGLVDFIQKALDQHDKNKESLLKEWPQLAGRINEAEFEWINEAKGLLVKYKEVGNG